MATKDTVQDHQKKIKKQKETEEFEQRQQKEKEEHEKKMMEFENKWESHPFFLEIYNSANSCIAETYRDAQNWALGKNCYDHRYIYITERMVEFSQDLKPSGYEINKLTVFYKTFHSRNYNDISREQQEAFARILTKKLSAHYENTPIVFSYYLGEYGERSYGYKISIDFTKCHPTYQDVF